MIELRAIGKHYCGVTALDKVDLSLEPGEVLGLIGPNGSGKTTLIGIASGVLRPSDGTVVVDGVDLTGKGPGHFARHGIGRTFQQIRLFDDMSVKETVAVGAIAKGIAHGEAAAALATLGLAEDADRQASTLAYGMQRRVEIARALAGRPRYLLLDEPAAGMNEVETDDLLDTLRTVAVKVGCGVLIVDHDMHLIMEICDRIQVLNEGRTLAEDAPGRIVANPAVIEAYIGTPEHGGMEDANV